MKSLTFLRAWIVYGSKEFPWITKIDLFIQNPISGAEFPWLNAKTVCPSEKVEILQQY